MGDRQTESALVHGDRHRLEYELSNWVDISVWEILKPFETITLNVGDSLACNDGDSFVFADGVVVRITGNKLVGLSKGTTYVQKKIGNTNILSYKVVVE